jgi:cell division protein ZapA
MMDNKLVVRVRIVGDEYTIRTEASPEHTKTVAEHVDRTIRAIMGGASTMETQKAAILAALQITDELFRERDAMATMVAAVVFGFTWAMLGGAMDALDAREVVVSERDTLDGVAMGLVRTGNDPSP